MRVASFSIPCLQTECLILRDYRQADCDDFAAFVQSERSRFIGGPEPEVAWVMTGHAEGRGIVREAAEAAREYAFGPLGWTTAISAIDPGNARSIRLAEPMSCRREGDFTHVRLGRM